MCNEKGPPPFPLSKSLDRWVMLGEGSPGPEKSPGPDISAMPPALSHTGPYTSMDRQPRSLGCTRSGHFNKILSQRPLKTPHLIFPKPNQERRNSVGQEDFQKKKRGKKTGCGFRFSILPMRSHKLTPINKFGIGFKYSPLRPRRWRGSRAFRERPVSGAELC